MPITPNALIPNACPNFNGILYQFLYQVEGDVPFVYSDSNGIPTLGVGYALLDGTPGKHNWALHLNYQTELLNAGISLTDTQLKALNDNLTLAMNALNGQGGNNPFSSASANTNILDWTITTPQGQSLFNTIIRSYETQVKTWLGNDVLYTSLQGSYELLVLTSLAYNGMLGKSPTLKADILAGNRADAWFQIRYESNGGQSKSPGIAKRRYEEAAMFGLYNDNSNIQPSDAIAVYQMFTQHRDAITNYDNKYANPLASAKKNELTQANIDLQKAGFTSVGAQTWQQAFQPAAKVLDGIYGFNFNETDIYATNAPSTVFNGSAINRSTDTGADLIIGGVGNDTLIGGKGSDTFVYIPPASGTTTETINDKLGQGVGSLYVGQKLLTTSSTIIKSIGMDPTSTIVNPVYVWKGADGTLYKYAPLGTVSGANAISTLTISGGALAAGDQIVINDFDLAQAQTSAGYLGIHLQPDIAIAAGTNPLFPNLSNPDTSSTSVPKGNTCSFSVYGTPGSTYQLSCTGPGTYWKNGGATTVPFANGTVDVTIPAGQNYVTVTLIDTSNSSNPDTATLTATTKDTRGNIITSNTLAVTFDSPGAASSTVTPAHTITGGFDPSTRLGNFYATDSLGNIIPSTIADPSFQDTLWGSGGNDLITTGNGGGWVMGMGGNDTIVGMSGPTGYNDGSYNPVYILTGDAFANNWRPVNGVVDASLMYDQPTLSISNQGDKANDLITGNGGLAFILAGNGNNQIYANKQVDLATALAGQKYAAGWGIIAVGDGNNTIVGGSWSPILVGTGNNTIVCGSGQTTLVEGVENVTLLNALGVPIGPTNTPNGPTFSNISFNSAAFNAPSNYHGAKVGGVAVGVGNDTIYGGPGDSYYGLSNGNNWLDAGGGNDTIQAGVGNNTIFGGVGNDVIMGGGGSNYINLESGSDTVTLNGGNNTVIGGTGNNLIVSGDYANWATSESNANNYIFSGSGNSTVYGSGGNDTLISASGTGNSTIIYAGDGKNQYIVGGHGTDSLFGGAGSDTIYAGDGNTSISLSLVATEHSTVYGGNGSDTITGGAGTDVISAGDGGTASAVTQVTAGSGTSTITGGAGVDKLIGGSGSDTLIAGTGTSTLQGGSGTEVMYSSSGNATLIAGTGSDTLYGGSGSDVLRSDVLLQGQTAGTTLFVAGSGNETIIGGKGTNTYEFDAGFGNIELKTTQNTDTFIFGAGISAADLTVSSTVGGDGSAALLIQNAKGGQVTIDGGLTGAISQIAFSDGSSPLTLSGLLAQSGIQVVQNSGNNMPLVGGTGNTTFLVNNSNVAVQAQATGSNTNTVMASVSYDLTNAANVQNLTATGSDNLTLQGNSLDNIITANSGNDTLIAGSGNDLLQGGNGNTLFVAGTGVDTIVGGSGSNRYEFDPGFGQVELQNTKATDTISFGAGIKVTDLTVSVVTGNDGNPALIIADSTGGQITVDDGLSGAVGNFTFTDPVTNAITTLTLKQIIAQANYVPTTIAVNGGDVIYGAGGNAMLTGGTGKDTIYAWNGGNTVTAGSGDQTLISESGSDLLQGGVGNDTLISAAGNDTLRGGTGKTTFVVNSTTDLIQAQATGTNTVQTSVSYDLNNAAGVQNLTATGSDNVTLTANTLNDVITANSGNDILIAGSGNDTLIAGSGTDLLQGGSGNSLFVAGTGVDTIIGGSGSNRYEFDPGFGQVELQNTKATDTIIFGAGINVSDLTVSVVTGIDGNPALTITDSTGGQITVNDGLSGTVGNFMFIDPATNATTTLTLDQLIAQVQPASATIAGNGGNIIFDSHGNQTLLGGAGDNTIYAWNGGNTLTAGSGNQTLISESGNDVLQGGAGNDTLISATGGDRLIGGTGNSTLISKSGNDTLMGGTGDTTFVVNSTTDLIQVQNTGTNTYTVQTSVSYDLKNAAGVQNLTATGSANVTLTANNLDDVITANSGNDTLNGGAGLDTFVMPEKMGAITISSANGGIIDLGIYSADELTPTQIGSDLKLQIGGTGSSILLTNYFGPSQATWTIKGSTTSVQDIVNAAAQSTLPDTVSNMEKAFLVQSRMSEISSLRASGYVPYDGSYLNSSPLSSVPVTAYLASQYVSTSQAIQHAWSVPTNVTVNESSVSFSQESYTTTDASVVYTNGGYSSSSSSTTGTAQISWQSAQINSNFWIPNGYYSTTYSYSSDIPVPGTIFSIPPSTTTVITGNLGGGPNSQSLPALPSGMTYPTSVSVTYVNNHQTYGIQQTTLTGNGQTVWAGSNDIVISTNGNDSINNAGFAYGGTGNDTLVGGGTLVAGSGNDLLADGTNMYGGSGNDTLIGFGGGYGGGYGDSNGYLVAGTGNDVLMYGDTMIGGSGNDTLIGGNIMIAGSGFNKIFGGGFGSTIEIDPLTVSTDIIGGGGYSFMPPYIPGNYPANDFQDLAAYFANGTLPQNTVAFGAGIKSSDITLSWGQVTGSISGDYGLDPQSLYTTPGIVSVAQALYTTLIISWGTNNQSIQVMIPHTDDPLGSSVSQFTFTDGDTKTISMAQMIAKAPPAPTFDPQIFQYQQGMGSVVLGTGYSSINFGAGITSSMITLGLGSLMIRVGNSGDVIHISNFDPSNALAANTIQYFNFADGTSLSYDQMLARGFDIYGTTGDQTLSGTNLDNRIYAGTGNDTLIGGGQNDTLYGGVGNDTLVAGTGAEVLVAGTGGGTMIGGSGSDTFMLNLGDGQQQSVWDTNATIALSNGQPAYASSKTFIDAVQFGDGITAGETRFQLRGADLLVNYGMQGDSFLIKDFVQGLEQSGYSSIGHFYYADGSKGSLWNTGSGSMLEVNYDASGNVINSTTFTTYFLNGVGKSLSIQTVDAAGAVIGSSSWNLSTGAGSSSIVNSDGSRSTYTDNGYGYTDTKNFASNGVMLSETSVNLYFVDPVLGNQYKTTTTLYDASGNLASDSWSQTDGSHGTDTLNANGSCSGIVHNPDGSYWTFTQDAWGNNYNNYAELDYAANGTLTGSYTYTSDGLGNYSDAYYDATGNKLSDDWGKADGSYGSDTFGTNGSSSGTAYNADGSYSSYTNDGHGDITTTRFDASGTETGYSMSTNGGLGNTTIANFNLSGVKLSDSWTQANGTTGSDTFNVGGVAGVMESKVTYTNADGSTYSTDTVNDPNGSYQQSTVKGDGSTTTTNYNAVTGEVIGSVTTTGAGYSYTYDNTVNVNGVSGETESKVAYTYAGGSTYSTDTVYDPNGSYQQSTVKGDGSTTTTNYNAVTGEVIGSVATAGAGYSYTYDNTVNVNGVAGETESKVNYTYANGSTYGTDTVYDPNGSYQQSTAKGDGSTTTTNYNAVTGEVIGSVATAGAGYSYTYDNSVNVNGMSGETESKMNYTYAGGSTYGTDTVYDPNGSYQQSTVKGDGSTTTTNYNAATGEVIGSVATAGAGYSYTYDNTVNVNGVAGETESKVAYTYANGSTYSTDTVYDPNGSYQQSTVKGDGSTTTTDYNAVTGEVIGSVATAGAGYSYTYDNTVNVNGVAGETESKVAYTYTDGSTYTTDTVNDPNGSYQQSTVKGDGSTTTTNYNAVTGEVIGSVATAGAGYSYTYDNTVNVNGISGETESKVAYTYADGSTYATDTVYDPNGSYQQSTAKGDGSTTTTNYNAVTGEVIGSVATTGAGYSYTYDNTVNVNGVAGETESKVNYTYAGGSTYGTDIVYDPNGSYQQSTVKGDGTTTTTNYNAVTGEVIGSVATAGAGYSYTYDNTVNVNGVSGETESKVNYTYADGSTYGTDTVYNPDSSYFQAWSKSDGTAGSSAVNANGTLAGDSWVHADGNQGVDAGGNHLLVGSTAGDTLAAASGNDILIGGAGNDTLTTGSGSNLIAFNAGDGQDIVNATAGQNNTLSLGGHFAFSDLALQKNGSDLILDIGASDSITFKNWYAGSQNIVNLQVVESAMTDFNHGSTDVLRNSNVENFDFQGLVAAFDQAQAANPGLNAWGVTNDLLTAHLASSDTAALGGDLAYVYGSQGSLSGMNVAAAENTLSNTQFAAAPQTLHPWPTLNTGTAQIR